MQFALKIEKCEKQLAQITFENINNLKTAKNEIEF